MVYITDFISVYTLFVGDMLVFRFVWHFSTSAGCVCFVLCYDCVRYLVLLFLHEYIFFNGLNLPIFGIASFVCYILCSTVLISVV
jgi:hypothetical protein